MFGSFGWMELLLILFIVLIIFGAGKLPQLGEGIGKAIKGFKRSVHEAESTVEETVPQGERGQATLTGPGPADVEASPATVPPKESQSSAQAHPHSASSGPV